MERAGSPRSKINTINASILPAQSRIQTIGGPIQGTSPVRIFQGQPGTPAQSIILGQVPIQIQTVQVENVQKVRELEAIIVTLQNEIEAYKKRCLYLENQVHQQAQDADQIRLLEARSGALIEENKRLNELLKEKIIEIHRSKSQYEEAQLLIQQLRYYEIEFAKIKDIFNVRQQELDTLRHQYAELETNFQQTSDQRRELQVQLQELRQQSEVREKSQNETIKRTQDFHRSQVQTYEEDIINLKALLEESVKENQKWKAKYHDADATAKDVQIKFTNADEQVTLLRQEIDRLTNFLDQKADEIENWRLKNTQLESQLIQCQSYESELKRLSDLVTLKKKELEAAQETISRTELEAAQQVSKNRSLELQIDALREQLRKLQADSENSLKLSQRQQRQTQDNLEVEIRRLQELADSKAQQVEEWKVIYARKAQDYDDLKLIEPKIKDLEEAVGFKNQEIDEVVKKLRDKINESEDLKLKIRDQQRQIEQLNLLRHDKEELENRIKYYLQELEQLRKEKVQKIDEVEKLTYENNRLAEDGQRVGRDLQLTKESLEYRIAEIEDLLKTNQRLESALSRLQPFETEMLRLRELNEIRIKEIEDLRLKLASSELNNQQLKLQSDELDNKCRQLVNEIERLQKLLVQRGEAIDNLRQNLAESDVQLALRSAEISKQEQKLREYEGKLTLMAVEIEKLTSVLKLKSDEYERLMVSYKEASAQVQRYTPFEADCQRLNEIILSRDREIEDLKQHIQQFEARLFQLQRVEDVNRELEERLKVLSNEIQRLQITITQRDRDIDTLKRQITILDTTRVDLENKIQILATESDKKDKALQQAKSETLILSQRITEMQIQVTTLTDYEYKIKILNTEVDRLTRENSEAQKELETWRYKYAEWSVLSQQVQDLKVSLVLSGALIESQQQRLTQKEVEVESLRKSQLGVFRK